VLLLTDGIEKVSGFLPSCQGIDTARLVSESQIWLGQVENGEPLDWSRVPLIRAPTGEPMG
jgi:hypothetical protein